MNQVKKTIFSGKGTGSTTINLTKPGFYVSILNEGDAEISVVLNADGQTIYIPGSTGYNTEYTRLLSIQITATNTPWYAAVST